MSFGGPPANPFAMTVESANTAFNPARKNASIIKWDLDTAQELEVSAETARQKTEENLRRPDIGPSMKRHMALSRELAEFLPESTIKDGEYQQARLSLFLYDKIERRTRANDMDPANPEDTRLAAWFTGTSRDTLRNEEKRTRERAKEAQAAISDINAQLVALKERIDQCALKNRISMTKKRGDTYYMIQRRTSGLVMPKHLPQEIVGNSFYKLFATEDALLSLNSVEAIETLKNMLDCTPIEHFNDRRILQDCITRLGTNKEWTRREFLMCIQGTFQEHLEVQFRTAFHRVLMDDSKRFLLDVPMDKDRREDALLDNKKFHQQRNEKLVLERRKLGMTIHDGLREAEKSLNARLARESSQKKSGQGNTQNNRNRRRGRGGQPESNSAGNSGNSGHAQKGNQGQQGQKRPYNGNGGGNNNRTKKGPRAAPAKAEPKESK
jgi:hypothetical protein